jgi:hypothetical protein
MNKKKGIMELAVFQSQFQIKLLINQELDCKDKCYKYYELIRLLLLATRLF